MNGGHNMTERRIRDMLIQHEPEGRVTAVSVDGRDLTNIIHENFNNISLNLYPSQPYTSQITLPLEYKQVLQTIFKAIDELYESNNPCLAAYLSSFLFERFTPYWSSLLKNGQHAFGVQFWNEIISVTAKWEESNGKHIHKGSPYAFLAFTYLIQGNIDLGFSFIYNAVEEDTRLASICPSLNYPNKAPAYLTAILSSNPNNMFMGQFVAVIRSELDTYLNDYRANLGKALTLAQFDRKFLLNRSLDASKYYFVFIYWTIFEYRRNIGTNLMQNEFSKLKNSNWLFALCLVIDTLFNHKYGTKKISDGIKKYSVDKNLMTEDDFNKLISQESIAKGEPDRVTLRLLSEQLTYNGSRISKEIQYLLIAWNLRNFAGHNIKMQNIFVSKFDDLLRILLYDIFLIVEDIEIES